VKLENMFIEGVLTLEGRQPATVQVRACRATVKITLHAADRPPKQFDQVDRNTKSEAVQLSVQMIAALARNSTVNDGRAN
jgi:hypothetical protein